MENRFSEEIENFLSDKMTSSQKDVFLSRMKSNPELKEQVQFQKDIINGIQYYRKQELKNRLVQIPVTGTETILQSLSAFKTAGIAAISTGVIITAVLFYNSDNQQVENVDKDILPENQVTVTEETKSDQEPQVDLTETEAEKNNSSAQNGFNKQNTLEEGTVSAIQSSKNQISKSTEQTEPAEEIRPFEPELVEDFDESEHLPEVSSINKKDITALSTRSGASVAVEKIDDGIHNFHYKYFNNKLYLYGSFGQGMYEIIEVNPDNQKRLFLYYNDTYFEIKPNQKNITKLKAIANESIRANLDSIRQ